MILRAEVELTVADDEVADALPLVESVEDDRLCVVEVVGAVGAV